MGSRASPSTAVTHEQITLDLNADVAEWCPLPRRHRLLAAGTYQLNEASQQREGRLYLYELQGEIGPQGQKLAAHQLGTQELPGIFDLRWLPQAERPTLAAALADGTLRLLEARDGHAEQPLINETASSGTPDADMGMAVSVDCATLGTEQPLVCSYSSGALGLYQVRFTLNSTKTCI